MTTSDYIAIVSACIAVVSVITAIVAIIVSWRANKKAIDAQNTANKLLEEQNKLIDDQVSLQKEMTSIENTREEDRAIISKQAIVRAEVICKRKEYSSKTADYLSYMVTAPYQLVIENTGMGTATNLSLLVDGKRISEHENFGKKQEEGFLIGPRSKISIPINKYFKKLSLEVSWEDNSGIPGNYQTTLML